VNESRKQSQEEVDDDRWFVVEILLFSLNEKQKKNKKKTAGVKDGGVGVSVWSTS
jgi:hypothetical protein